MASKDKPNVNLTLSSLKAETASPEPFVFAIDAATRITFPDLFDIPVEEAEAFFEDMDRYGQNDMKFLKKWLSEKDYETYRAAGLNLRTHAAIMRRVLDYYEGTMGRKGEGSASRS